MRRLAALLALAVLGLGLPASAVTTGPPRARLSGDVIPVAYDLSVMPDLETMRTAGSETIDVEVRRPVDAIVLNARRIAVRRAAIDGRSARATTKPKLDQLELRAQAPIPPGRHRVALTFESEVHRGDANGLFAPPSPIGPSLTTLFEPSTARTMFPCFDEPQFRARFSLHVRAPRDWTVVSNMPLRAKRDAEADLAWSDFEPSPPMPAYTLTLDAGPFVHVDGTASGVPIRIFVRAGQEEHARAMLADAQRLLPFYESFFGVPFPLPKMDLVVTPGVLQSAFEGWGAITFYSESAPFGAQFNGGAAGRRYAVEILAHEMAHQWTGDLVTMRWWRDTFVSEGVAQFSQRAATRAVFQELHTWLDDDRAVASVMGYGVGPTSKPVLNPVATDREDDAFASFNEATYEKGASVLEGWRAIAGETALRDGLRRYLRRFAFGSATFEDFWDALGGRDGVAYGRSWLAQRGFPVVDVRASCEGAGTTVVTTQSAYVSDPQMDAAYRGQRWIVPLTLRIGAHGRRLVQSTTRAVQRIDGCGPLVVDPGERPYYFVRYDDAAYRTLARSDALGERDRERLFRDATMLHTAGALGDSAYLRLIATASEPLAPDVWVGLAQECRRMNELVREAPEAAQLAAMERNTLLPFALRYGRTGSKEPGPFRLGYDSAAALATSGDAVAGARFHDDYTSVLEGGPVDNGQALWSTPQIAAAAATPDDVDRTETRLRAAPAAGPVVPFGTLFLESVGDDALARRVLDDAMNDRRLTQNAPLAFLFAFGNRHPSLAYAYLRTHLRTFAKALPPTQQAWVLSRGVADSLWPAAPPTQLEAFLRAQFPHDRRTVTASTARIEQNWKARRALIAALHELLP